MTRVHRQYHRRVLLMLLVLLPLVFVLGLRARRPAPVLPPEAGLSSAQAAPFEFIDP